MVKGGTSGPGADAVFFLGGGALVSCSTSTGAGGGGARPLHPPPRSAPEGGDSPYKILFCTPPGGFAGETHYRVEPRLPLSAINN